MVRLSAFIMAPFVELAIGKEWVGRFRDTSQGAAGTIADM